MTDDNKGIPSNINHEIDLRNSKAYDTIFLHDQGNQDMKNFIEKTLEMTRQSNYRSGRYLALVILSANEMFLGNYEAGIDYVRQIDKDVMLNDAIPFIQMLYFRTFMLYYVEHMGNLTVALEYAQKELKAAEAYGDQQSIMRCRLHLAALSLQNGMYATAEPMFLKAASYAESVKDPYLLVHVYANLGELLYRTNKMERSEEIYLKCLSHAKDGMYLPIQHGVHIDLSMIEKHRGNLEGALKYLKNSELMEDQNIRLQEVFRRGHEQFIIYMSLEKTKDATNVLNWLNQKLDALKNITSAIQFHKDQAELYSTLEQYDRAYEAIQKSLLLTEEFQSLHAAAEINQIIEDEHTKELSRLDALTSIGHKLNILADIDEMVNTLNETLKTILPADTLGIALLKDGQLHFNHYMNEDVFIETSATDLTSQVSLAVWSAQNRESVVINDLSKDYSKYISRIGHLQEPSNKVIQSVLFKALIIKDELLGVFTVQSYKTYAYSSVEQKIHSIITDYLASAVNNVLQNERLRNQSIRDALTGLLNRRGLLEAYAQLIQQKTSKKSFIAALMLDLDHFKIINDTYGHQFGDHILIATAGVLKDHENTASIGARLGGEEFCLFMLCDDHSTVANQAEKIRSQVESLKIYTDTGFATCTVSIGVTVHPLSHAFDYNLLYHESDKALYQAKSLGRNQVVFYEG